MSPYIVTTTRTLAVDATASISEILSRRAVATLEEAREIIADLLQRDWHQHRTAVYTIPESGGTVGPLPDGTVIEVRRVAWAAVGWMHGPFPPAFPQSVLEAFNDRQVTA